MSTKRTVVHLVEGPTVAGAEASESGKHPVLETMPALEFRMGRPDIGQERSDHRADRRVLLGGPGSGAAIDVV